jgi:hypothetical protein
MHDDRVPNVSRCTQLAAFGRSSPSVDPRRQFDRETIARAGEVDEEQ